MKFTIQKQYLMLVVGMSLALVIGSFIYDFFDSQDISDSGKLVEITQSYITGYDKGKLNWKVSVDNAWAKKNRSMYYANRITSGVIYNAEGDIIIDSITASGIKINTKINSITIKEGAMARFMPQSKTKETGLIAQENVSKNPIIIKSDELRYYSDSEKVYLNKGVELIKDSHVIKPLNGAEIDNETKVVYVDNGFHIESDEFFVSGNKMVIYIDEEFSKLSGNLMFERYASENIDESLDEQEKTLRQESSLLYADEGVFYESDEGDMLYVTGNVRVKQPDKEILAYTGYYNQTTDIMSLNKDISISLDTLNWALDQSTKDNLSNDDIKNSLNQKTRITCHSFVFDGSTRKTTLKGNIKIVQSDKTIFCNKLIMSDETSIVECFGNVKVIKDKKDSIKTEYLVIDLNKETFTAKRGVYSEYHLDEN
ncbi:hypothetical protein CL658_00025 [bacterium]|nr:hypothetical protein [bacterium]|tara:strand:- start:1738 stop:3015 length:1278 start_codon:yes stop_codon:yes gene_type:complete